MAFGRDTVAKNIKPLTGAKVRRATLGATVSAGELITLQSDGFWDPSNATTNAQLTVRVAAQSGVSGDEIDTVTHGPVLCTEDATPGGLVFTSNTAGEPGESAGTKDTIVGYSESATVVFVQPQIIDLA